MFKFWLYKIGQCLANCLSWPASYRTAVFLSDIQYYFSPRDQRAVRHNLRAILSSDKNLSKSTREVFRNFGLYLNEFFRMPKMMDKDYIQKKIKIKNIERLQEVLKQGKGGILITAHLGNWEMGGVLLSLLGYPIMAIALPHKERPVNDLFNHQRGIKGLTIVPPQHAIRRCMEQLKSNKFVALVADRDFSLTGAVLPFLGKRAMIPKGAAVLSYKTQAPIIPIFLIRQPDHTFILTVEEPIIAPIEVNEAKEEDILLDIMKKYTAVIEAKIRQYPTQWLMFRQFWVA